MVAKKKEKENKGVVKTETVATAAAPAAMTTQEMDLAEGLVKRLEDLDKSSMKDMRELLATVARTINLIRYCDSKGLLSPKAAADQPAPAAEEKPADLPSPEDTASEWRDMLLDHFKMASIEGLLAGLLFEEIKLSSKDLFAEIRAIAVERVRRAFQAEELESDGPGDIYSLVMGLRSCRLGEKCRIW